MDGPQALLSTPRMGLQHVTQHIALPGETLLFPGLLQCQAFCNAVSGKQGLIILAAKQNLLGLFSDRR